MEHMMPIGKAAVVVNRAKSPANALAAVVCDRLERAGVATLTVNASACGDDGSPWAAAADVVITLGGDGTILAASRVCAPLGTPILGVHLGRFGFIAEAHPDSLLERLEDLLAGRYELEQRIMLHGEVRRGGTATHAALGLNDVVVSKGAMTRMLHLTMRFAGGPPMDYMADGVIVASPTGSTGYALSAGGPLMAPTVQALLVAPICPHTLAARPVVVPDTQEVEFVVGTDGGEVTFSADGASVYALEGGDAVRVRRSEHCTRLIVFRAGTFYDKVHDRLLWGERVNE